MNADDGETCDVSQSTAAKLVVVRLGELLLHVTAFRERPKPERRQAQCPACLAQVTIRDGKRRIPHAAHRPGTGEGCPATVGESALHLNTKVLLGLELQALADRARADGQLPAIEIALACLANPDCRIPAWCAWPITWDHVDIECRVGMHRPDLVLSLDGVQVAAIEVMVTHEVVPEKATALRLLGVPWLEVVATAVATDGGQRLTWRSTLPLPVHRASQDGAQGYCPSHDVKRRLEAARERYRALKDRDDPGVQEVESYGRQLRQSEEEIVSILAQTTTVTAAVDAEESRLAELNEDLPRHIYAAEQRLARAKEGLAMADRLAADRMSSAKVTFRASVLGVQRLLELEAELKRYERLRRQLSADYDECTLSGQFKEDIRRTLFWRVYDVYRTHSNPRRQSISRSLFHIDLVKVPGKGDDLVLVEDGHAHRLRVEAVREDAAMRLRESAEQRIEELRRSGALVDWPCDWMNVPYGEEVPDSAWLSVTGPAPCSYDWDEDSRAWMVRGLVGPRAADVQKPQRPCEQGADGDPRVVRRGT